MEQISLGETGLRISPIGMGSIQITRLEWNQSIKVVREVMDLGINWFDTARAYFDSELRLGEALKGNRNKVFISTKSGMTDPKDLQIQIDESLQRLHTDYIDIFLFHGDGAIGNENFLAPGGTLETAKKAIKAGKIRYLGFSAHRVDPAIKALDVEQLKVAMVPANFISREFIDGDFMAKARKNKIAVVAMKPFGGGRMGNARICLKFLKSYPNLIPCIGIEKTLEMAENLKIWTEEEPLTAEDYKEMNRIKDLLGDKFCRLCYYCMPCPENIQIPNITFLKVFAKQNPRDKVVTDDNRQAVEMAKKCTKCRKCVEKCPFHLSIPEMLEENIAFYEEFSKEK